MTERANRYIVHRAWGIQRTLGNRTAAGYLRNMGLSCEAALAILCPRRFCK